SGQAHGGLAPGPPRRKCRAPGADDLTQGPHWRWWNPPRMTAPLLSAPPALCVLLAFNGSNQLAVRAAGASLDLAFVGADEATARARLQACFPVFTPPAEHFTCTTGGPAGRVFFTQVQGGPAAADVVFRTLDELQARP